MKTLNNMRPPAEICRENGWKAGTMLVGDEGIGPTVIEITAVGEERVLAKIISHNGKPSNIGEGSWALWCRDWREQNEVKKSEVDWYQTKVGW